ncbi:hypothetical protein CIL05_17185 [Virgibacillus profundi]|uniref:DUF2326 domain-containing protein n=1 Tax=Virgibacillus profundi TaxID=2024555 RepID=A0A2A2IBA2_9BACI|nr:hypothetical protein [Virgibacillus profundi]PAV28425.1 hypothetical protein CIL05_17185 [Virgibacillus profundi]PXY52338.1 hypothetical protein CIT14_18590 [Virgibacillus profundi]
MNKLVVKKIYIFELSNKLAKRVDFEEGINIITSDKEKGNDVGKSIILKSIYHTLGADSIFDDKWTSKSKVYLLHVNINTDEYFIYRNDKMFKIYSGDFKKQFSTINRKELSEYLECLYGFSVKLPNRNDEELELTPPVYSYLLNYVDQDHMNGSKFDSFMSLGQYPNYKENVLYNHFGILTDEYFEAAKKIEELKREEKSLLEEKLIVDKMLKKIRAYLEGIDAPGDEETLRIELNKSKKEYTDIVVSLKKAKNKLTKLRNEKIELESTIKDLLDIKKTRERGVQKINKNVCPTCSQHIDNIGIRISENSQLEDLYIIKDELDALVLEVNRKLMLHEEKYLNILSKYEQFEKSIEFNNNNISDVFKHRGYMETRDNLVKEFGTIEAKISDTNDNKKEKEKIIKKYKKLKDQANSLYEQYMIESIEEFGLEEINSKSVKHITNNLKARGSNIPITTIIWHFNLLKIKNELNKESIKFPIVLDSPNNVELDDNKEKALFNYIFTNRNKDTQLILSTLGFNAKDYEEVKIDKIIELKNKKYNLLNHKEYEENKDILEFVFNNE